MNDNGPIESADTANDGTGQDPMQAARARDALLVERVRAGDTAGFGELYDIWFERVFNVALRIVHDRDLAADLTQDSFLAAWRALDSLTDPKAFGGWLLRITRNTSLNKVKREGRSSPVGSEGMEMIERRAAAATTGAPIHERVAHLADPSAVAGDTQLVTLVREVAASLGERDAEVLDLTLRYQLTPAEVGQVLDLNRNAANQLCHRVRTHFATAFSVRMLFDGGAARCGDLQRELAAQHVTRFGPEAVRIADRHAQLCSSCGEDRRTRVAPSTLFAAVPLVPALALTRQRVAHALATEGVPMHGSAASTTSLGFAPEATGSAPSDPDDRRPRAARVAAVMTAGVLVLLLLWVWAGHEAGTPTADPAPSTLSGLSGVTAGAADAALSVEDGLLPAESTTEAAAPDSRPAPSTSVPATSTAPTDAASIPGPDQAPSTTGLLVMIPQISVQKFELLTGSQFSSPWSNADAPKLSWAVTGAKEVLIRSYVDFGNGPERQGEFTVANSGTRVLCPGQLDGQGVCTAPAGQYTYQLVLVRFDDVAGIYPQSVSIWVS